MSIDMDLMMVILNSDGLRCNIGSMGRSLL